MSTYKKWIYRKLLIRYWNPIVEWVVYAVEWFIVEEPKVIFPMQRDGSFYSEEHIHYIHKKWWDECNGHEICPQT